MIFKYTVKWILRPSEYWPKEVEKFTLVDGKWLNETQILLQSLAPINPEIILKKIKERFNE